MTKRNFRLVAHDLSVVRGRAAARPHQPEITFGNQSKLSRNDSVKKGPPSPQPSPPRRGSNAGAALYRSPNGDCAQRWGRVSLSWGERVGVRAGQTQLNRY